MAYFEAQLTKLGEDEQRAQGDVGKAERQRAWRRCSTSWRCCRDFLERSEELYRVERDLEIGDRDANLTAMVDTARNTVYSFESEAVELKLAGRAARLR